MTFIQVRVAAGGEGGDVILKIVEIKGWGRDGETIPKIAGMRMN